MTPASDATLLAVPEVVPPTVVVTLAAGVVEGAGVTGVVEAYVVVFWMAGVLTVLF